MFSFCLYSVSHLIEGFIAYYYYENILITKKTSIKKPLYILAYFMLLCIMFLNHPTANMFSYVIINYALSSTLYYNEKGITLFYSALLTIFMIATELLAALFTSAKAINVDMQLSTNTTTIVCFIISKLLYLVIILLFTNRITRKKKNISGISKELVIILLVCTILCYILCNITYTTRLSETSEYLLVFSFSLIILIVLFVLWFQDYIQKKENELTQIKLSFQQEQSSRLYFDTIRENYIDRNIMIHDIKNHIMIIQQLNRERKTDEVDEYLTQLVEHPALSKRIKHTGIEQLNILLNVYDVKCEQHNIKFTVDCENSYKNFMKITHLTGMFCNLLDNAFEAALKSNNPYIELILRYNKTKNYAKLSISNSCTNMPVTDSQNKLLSSKDNPYEHGIGISSIERIIQFYDGNMYSYYDDIEKSYHTIITLFDKSTE